MVPKVNTQTRINQILSAAIIFLTYLTVNDANKVYGCSKANDIIKISSIVGIFVVWATEKKIATYFEHVVYKN